MSTFAHIYHGLGNASLLWRSNTAENRDIRSSWQSGRIIGNVNGFQPSPAFSLVRNFSSPTKSEVGKLVDKSYYMKACFLFDAL
jgi:hypothetical protein